MILGSLILNSTVTVAQYTGTASVTQGEATTTVTNLYASGQRVAGVGTITSTDDLTWTVPASTNYANSSYDFCPDLYNEDGTKYNSAAAALAAYSSSDIVEIDSDGEIFTMYLFSDNYFELYINGTFIGKDAIPFTSFNSHIVKFKVSEPFTIAMMLVDWEENLGLGSENQATDYHPGDGGMIAVIKDANDDFVKVTGDDWKAQTYYTSPIRDLSCPTESNNQRLSSSCDDSDSNDDSQSYALHWAIDATWYEESYDDSSWPSATTYTSSELGMDNKTPYTDFLDVFDDNDDDAEFIWSTNVILDNVVLVRSSEITLGVEGQLYETSNVLVYPNPTNELFTIDLKDSYDATITNSLGQVIQTLELNVGETTINLEKHADGLYFINGTNDNHKFVKKIIKK